MENLLSQILVALLSSVITVFLFSEKIKYEQRKFLEEFEEKNKKRDFY